ncbi:hypothetical protein [Phormidium nigroviride]|uniref:hypothetical protein n=1 Tax=Phormidium nigroviride TaxID=482564 RepID=UPI00167FA632|nr:hypothetical protein [Oscillatoria nigro-viridis]
MNPKTIEALEQAGWMFWKMVLDVGSPPNICVTLVDYNLYRTPQLNSCLPASKN